MKSDCVVFVLVVSRTCAMIQCLCACLLAASALRWSLSLSLSLSLSGFPCRIPFLAFCYMAHSCPGLNLVSLGWKMPRPCSVLRIQGGSGVLVWGFWVLLVSARLLVTASALCGFSLRPRMYLCVCVCPGSNFILAGSAALA